MANPYHDDKGQFTSGGGGAAGHAAATAAHVKAGSSMHLSKHEVKQSIKETDKFVKGIFHANAENAHLGPEYAAFRALLPLSGK